jgi:hypothetical protein
VVVAAGALRGVLFVPGMIGHHWDWSMPTFAELLRNMALIQTSAWYPIALGSYAPYRYGSVFPFFVFGAVGFLGVSGELVAKGIVLAAMVTSGVGMYRFAREVLATLDGRAARSVAIFAPLVGGFVYMLSPYQYNQIIAGDLLGVVAYGIAPHAGFYLLRAAGPDMDWRVAIKAGITLGLIADCSVQPFVLTTLLVLGFVIVSRRSATLRLARQGGLIAIAGGLTTAYWTLPAMLSITRTLQTAASTTGDLSGVTSAVSRYSSVANGILGTAYFVPFYSQAIPHLIAGSWTTLSLITIALLVGTAAAKAVAHRGGWLLAFYWIVAYGAAVVLAAPATPIGQPILALYGFVPWALFFRTPQHLVFVAPWCISILVSLALSQQPRLALADVVRPAISIGLVGLCVGYLVAGNFNGYIGPFQTNRAETNIEQILSADTDPDARLLSLPGGPTRLFTGRAISDLNLEAGDDGNVIWSVHPAIAPEVKWSPSLPARTFQRMVFDTLVSQPAEARTLLNMAAVKYIEVTPYFSGGGGPDYLAYGPKTIQNNLSQLPFLKLLYSDNGWALYRDDDYQGQVFVAKEILTGPNDSGVAAGVTTAMSMGGTSGNPVYILSDQPAAQFRIDSHPIVALHADKNPVPAANRSARSNASEPLMAGWYTKPSLAGAIWNYFDPYPGPVFTISSNYTGDPILTFRFNVPAPGTYSLAALAVRGPSSPPVLLYVDNKLEATEAGALPQTALQPLLFGDLRVALGSGQHFLSVKARCSAMSGADTCSLDLLTVVLTPEFPSSAAVPGRFISHSPAEYDGRVRASDGSVIVVSQAFDPGWQATAESVAGNSTLVLPHFVASGYANAWLLPAGDWEITVRFLPQSVFSQSAFLSVVGLPILFLLATARRPWIRRRIRSSGWLHRSHIHQVRSTDD